MTIAPAAPRQAGAWSAAAWRRNALVAAISFLTLVDLFAAQAILPNLTAAYGTTAAQMSLAVNASTFGMAASGLAIAAWARNVDRWSGVWVSLALLSVPTALLASASGLAEFAALRVAQGVFMAAAFTLTLAYLAEHCTAEDAAGALAAYVTGNVACNVFGRWMSSALADGAGLEINFYAFAALNLLGAALAYWGFHRAPAAARMTQAMPSILAAWALHLRNPALSAIFAIGFIILFVFIGTFTFAGFVLRAEPYALNTMQAGYAYLVFLPAIVTTPFAGSAAARFGVRPVFWFSLGLAALGLPLLVMGNLTAMLAGLAAIGVGTFFAQAAATGFVSRAATMERGAASGLYLASYYVGGLAGTAVLGQVFQAFGWPASVLCLGVVLCAAMLCVFLLRLPAPPERMP
jgi:predicted MFS family arabinose efflux permease